MIVAMLENNLMCSLKIYQLFSTLSSTYVHVLILGDKKTRKEAGEGCYIKRASAISLYEPLPKMTQALKLLYSWALALANTS